MLKLARWSTTHRLYVVIGWIALLVIVNTLAQSAGTQYSNNFTLPNSDAQRAADLLQHSFPTQAGDRDQIVFRVRSGTVLDPVVRRHMSETFARIAKLPHVAGIVSPYDGAAAGKAISANRQIAFATVVFDEKANLLPKSAPEGVVKAAEAARQPGLQIELGGQAIEATEQEGFGLSTAVGLMAAIVVLLITFGSLLAMGLPIVTALFGLGTGLGAIALFTHVVDTPNFSSELAAMIGLGVGIDYSLFILTRFREAYTSPGPTRGQARESVVQAMDTAGRAVLFAGTTVVIALLGMMLLGVDFLYGLAISASIGVLLVMLASLTLLPALLTLAGARLTRPGRRARRRARALAATPATSGAGANGAATGGGSGAGEAPDVEHAPPAGRHWLRWSGFVQRHAAAIALGATLLMLLIAAPAIAPAPRVQRRQQRSPEHHHASRLRAAGAGLRRRLQRPPAGRRAPAPSRRRRRPGRTAERDLQGRRRGLGDPAPPQPQRRSGHDLGLPPLLAPGLRDQRTRLAPARTVIPPVAARTGLVAYVGGFTAGSVDFATVLAQKLPLFIGVVVLLSALLLMVVFRSIVIPIQAAIMNLLSIGASLGVIVVVFQWGWVQSLMGVSPGPIESFIPVMLFAIVFGLSMDYEVFLVSRIHEQWTHTRDNHRAVGEGLALTGRVVTAAAAIMVCVFLSFMLGENRVIKEFGLSLASAVFLDAVVVRCLLVPAVLSLLGERTWRIPGWLDRFLARLNIDGSSGRWLPESHAHPAPPGALEPERTGVL